jgi:hypothetical protein
MNEYLKGIGKLAGLNDKVEISKNRGGIKTK